MKAVLASYVYVRALTETTLIEVRDNTQFGVGLLKSLW